MLTYSLLSSAVKSTRRIFSTIRNYSTQNRSSKEEQEVIQKNWEIRCDLATAYRAMEMYGMSEGICNHLTAKVPTLACDEPIVLVIPYGIYWSEVTPDCLVGIDINTCKVVEGQEKVDYTASSIHSGIYRHRPDVNSVFHSHATYSTVISLFKDPTFKMFHQNDVRFWKNVAYKEFSGISDHEINDLFPVPIIPFQTFNWQENTLCKEGDRIGKSLGDKEVLMLENHGFITVGESIGKAFDAHYYFEQCAKRQVLAYQTGKSLSEMSEEIIKRSWEEFQLYINSDYFDEHLKALKKVMVKRDPTFLDQSKFNYHQMIAN